MKKILMFATAAVIGLAACNDDTANSTTTTTTDSSNNMSTTPATTATTATTSTNTVTVGSLEGRKLMYVKGNKAVTLKYDPDQSYYIDAETNKQANGYFYDPTTNDTFDYRGYIVNNALMNNNGNWTTDETRLWSNTYNTTLRDNMQSGNMKIKQDGNSYKEKTDTSKLKVTDDKMKAKNK